MRHRPQLLVLAGALTLSLAAAPFIATPVAANDRVIVVQAGQTLSEIAVREGVTVRRLVELNGLADPDRIIAGQRLRVSDGRTNGGQQARARAAATHRVAYGESLSGIAMRYGTTVAAIARANDIRDVSFIRAGQLLRIPGGGGGDRERGGRAAAGGNAAPGASWTTHRVAFGESLWGIAVRYGSTVSAIARANGIVDTSFIRVGQVLRVPTASADTGGGRAAPESGRIGKPNATMPADMAALVAARAEIGRLITAEARRQGVPPAFALAVAWQESGWQPRVVSYAGAVGVMQLLPATGEWVGSAMLGHAVNLWVPAQNVEAGVRLLRHYLDRYGGSRALALAAYYQGQTAADRYGVYPVSRPYIASILRLEQIFGG